jgi:S-adenosylmethionine:tRNA ribosyltransferase-isomerase
MPAEEVLRTDGELPLPPYIRHAPDATDAKRYQTVFARVEGAVAAPTAGLHFDRDVLDALDAAGVESATLTLHVGAGTFQPVRSELLDEHAMHEERYWIPDELAQRVALTRRRGGRIVAVGTTTVRALESAADAQGRLRPGPGETRLFITPGYTFKVVEGLVTNFHLPKSTLLVLVSAFAGIERIRTAYQHAIARRYRFFSYGDAMLLQRA